MVKNAFGPAAANAVNNSLKNTGNALKNTGAAVANVANGNFGAAANNVAAAANNAVAAATNGVNAAVNGAVNAANGAVNASKNALFGLPTAVGNAATAVGNTAKSAVNKMTNVVSNVGNTLGITNNANSANANSANKNNGANANNRNTGNNVVLNAANNALNAVSEGPGFFGSIWVWILIILLFAVGVFVFFYDQIMAVLPESVQSAFDRFKEAIGIPVEKPVAMPTPVPIAPVSASIVPVVPIMDVSGAGAGAGAGATVAGTGLSGLAGNLAGIINKQLPPQKKEVFNIKENKYKYEDAEPLCKALGAELATYDQVKDAYDAGADWCNYGWIKGQRAVYPTQEETYEKLQQGPVGQRQACGKPGVNGGYFDNPELRFGVNCYGTKPAQKRHDTTLLPNGEANPFSPDALEFDRRVAEFKADSANIGILPFKEGDWDEA